MRTLIRGILKALFCYFVAAFVVAALVLYVGAIALIVTYPIMGFIGIFIAFAILIPWSLFPLFGDSKIYKWIDNKFKNKGD